MIWRYCLWVSTWLEGRFYIQHIVRIGDHLICEQNIVYTAHFHYVYAQAALSTPRALCSSDVVPAVVVRKVAI